MQRLREFARCLEERADVASPLARWRLAAGAQAGILQRFLIPNGGAVSPVFPCPTCGRDMLIVPVGDGFGAEPDEDAECRSIEQVPAGEAIEYVIHWPAVMSMLAKTLDCTLELSARQCGCVCARGEVSRDFRRAAVCACFAESDTLVSEAAVRWLSEAPGPSLFVSAIHRPACARLLAKTACAYVAIEDVVGLDGAGAFVMVSDVMERLKATAAVREDGEVVLAVVQARDQIIGKVEGLESAVVQSLAVSEGRRGESERRRLVIEDMADGPERFLSGLAARMTDAKSRMLLFALMEKRNDRGRDRYLTYGEIGERLGGITKQAVAARVERLRSQHAGPWDYIESLRAPERAQAFSALSPTARTKHGIDKSYNYDAH